MIKYKNSLVLFYYDNASVFVSEVRLKFLSNQTKPYF